MSVLTIAYTDLMDEHLMVVEDEAGLRQVLTDYFSSQGYHVTSSGNGRDALAAIGLAAPDILLLDLSLPGLDGLEVTRQIRHTWSFPILILTARADELDKLEGLDSGADDYLTKPFSLKELGARVRALLRRSGKTPSSTVEPSRLSIGDVTLDPIRRTVTLRGSPLEVTSVQFDLMRTLMREPGRVFTRAQLLESVEGIVSEVYERTIDVHIKNLRKVLEDNVTHPRHILTIRGVGYKWTEVSP